MTYEEAIKYIHSVSNFFCKPGLERIRELCQGLGNPQEKLKFIHIGGTNGKGSTSAMLDSVLREAGYRVGLYTSPYVRVFNERMRVNGENIPNNTLARLADRAKAVAEKMADRPTEFELITAIAFDYFLEEKCDVVILEVGMGGRLDATNIIGSPMLSIITGISLDHTAFLGDTIEKIAAEKAGIIKKGTPTVWGGTDRVAESVILENAEKMQSTLYKTDHSNLKITKIDLTGSEFSYKGKEYKISLLGVYQPRNAATVLQAVEALPLAIGEDAIRRGLFKAKWPARFEIIKNDPMIIFDGGHNAEGISAAVDSIKTYFGKKKVVVITGVLRDKEYVKIADAISSVACEAFTITPSNPRALSAKEYADVLSCPAMACESIGEATERGIRSAIDNDTALLCLGSLYTYSEIISLIEKSDE